MFAVQTNQHIGINEVVKHSNKPDDVANSDPELRVWDALDAGTHDNTLQDAILEHMQARADMCPHRLPNIPAFVCLRVAVISGARTSTCTPWDTAMLLLLL